MKVTVYVASSVNGLISNSRNVPDWLSPEYGRGFEEVCQEKRAVIMGRKTYDILAPDYLPFKDRNKGISVVITSNTSTTPANDAVVFTSGAPDQIVAMLEEKGFPEAVVIGGTAAISEFVNAGLVDEIILVMEPALFGGNGLPLLKGVALDRKLKLVDTKRSEDTVRLHYRVVAG